MTTRTEELSLYYSTYIKYKYLRVFCESSSCAKEILVLQNPRVEQGLLCRDSVTRAHSQQFLEQILCFVADPRKTLRWLWFRVLSLLDCLEKFTLVRAFKRILSCQHYVKDNTASPHVCWRPEVLLALSDLGSHETRCATLALQGF